MKSPRLSNVKIGQKQFLVIVVPVLALMGFGFFVVSQKHGASTQMMKLERLAEFSPSITNLVHELQKERGYSAGFISSGGKPAFGRKVNGQHTITNSFRSSFEQSMSRFDKAVYGQEFSALLDKTVNDLSKLDSVRTDVARIIHESA